MMMDGPLPVVGGVWEKEGVGGRRSALCGFFPSRSIVLVGQKPHTNVKRQSNHKQRYRSTDMSEGPCESQRRDRPGLANKKEALACE